MINYTFHGMNIGQLLLWFFIYSFFGWAMECIVIRIQLGRWENRGFAKLPFCVIYGFGTFIAYNLFAPIAHNYVALYIAGCVCATIFEYIVAQIMLKLFGEVWWNYDHLPFNYKGILCLESTLGWGLLALFIFVVFNKLVEGFVFAIDPRIAAGMGTALAVMYIVDFSYHFTRRVVTAGGEGEQRSFENPFAQAAAKFKRK